MLKAKYLVTGQDRSGIIAPERYQLLAYGFGKRMFVPPNFLSLGGREERGRITQLSRMHRQRVQAWYETLLRREITIRPIRKVLLLAKEELEEVERTRHCNTAGNARVTGLLAGLLDARSGPGETLRPSPSPATAGLREG